MNFGIINSHSLCHICNKSITEHLLEDRLGGQHGAVDFQDLLLLDKVLPPGLQDVVLQGTAHRAEIIQTTHTCGSITAW